ncbi:hypothetical protein AXI57_01480 [Bacillus atrophaeus]|nr:hypothetical protein AXI57_01480 [Bacillus atrophaeus]
MFLTGNEKTEHKEQHGKQLCPSPFGDIGMKKAFHSMSPAFCVGKVHCSSTSYDWYLKKLLTKTLSYFMMKAHSKTKSSGIVTGKAGKT